MSMRYRSEDDGVSFSAVLMEKRLIRLRVQIFCNGLCIVEATRASDFARDTRAFVSIVMKTVFFFLVCYYKLARVVWFYF